MTEVFIMTLKAKKNCLITHLIFKNIEFQRFWKSIPQNPMKKSWIWDAAEATFEKVLAPMVKEIIGIDYSKKSIEICTDIILKPQNTPM